MNPRAFPALVAALISTPAWVFAAFDQPFEIHVVDETTGRGVPLVELETVNHMRYVTDNAGRVAFSEPGLMGQTVFFELKTHGYDLPKDGFGVSGTRLKVESGGSSTIKLKRKNIAERLYRTTGYGLYRDSVILEKKTPLAQPLGGGMVAGQDSVFGVPYRGKLYWFWGDTPRMSYPLGLFRTAGATSELPGKGGLSPSEGIDLTYFTDKEGFCRAMADVADPEGVVWIFGICTVPDDKGTERMVGHFSRRQGLGKEYQHGMMVYNDERDVFEVKTSLPLEDTWRFLNGQPAKVTIDRKEYIYCGVPFLNVRVPATLDAMMDPNQYEALSCIPAGADPKTADPERDANGAIIWKWGKGHPIGQGEESRWLKAGKIKREEARFLPEDSEKTGRHVTLHTGSVRWNPYRQRWIAIAVETAYHEKDYPSALGEVWYSESENPDGPFRKATRIVTHKNYTFYNPCHHPFFDEDGGRTIYFEGTYTNQFINAVATPLYDYNQVMYRLDLDHPRLKAAFGR